MLRKSIFAISIALVLILAGCTLFGQAPAPQKQQENNPVVVPPAQQNEEKILNISTTPLPPAQQNNSTAPDPTASVCGNGKLEAGEACDGYFGCQVDSLCGADCKCIPKPVPKCNFSITGISGGKDEYNVGEPVALILEGADADGSPLLQKNGYSVIAYIYDDPPTRSVSALEGNYMDMGRWELSAGTPLMPGNYYWKISLMCSKLGSSCDKLCGAGKQITQTLPFKVKQACTDTDGYDPYVKGTTTGMTKNGTIISKADSCEGMLWEYVCDGKWAKLQTLVCDNGCQGGVCTKNSAPMRILTATLPVAEIGKYYSATLEARGGLQPRSNWEIISGRLPAGLTLNQQTGEITGAPLIVETTGFTVSVEDANGNAVNSELSIETRQ